MTNYNVSSRDDFYLEAGVDSYYDFKPVLLFSVFIVSIIAII